MQIEDQKFKEIAKDLGIAFQLAGTTNFGAVAEVLFNAGYRKDSEIAREIGDEISKNLMLVKPYPEYVAIKATVLIDILNKHIKEN